MEDILNNKKICIVFMVFVFIVAGIFTFFSNTIDMDYWARILQGKFVIDFGKVMYSDPFSYTPTHIWLDHEWGSGVLFAFIQKYFGFTGILVLRTIITALIFLSAWNINKLTEKKNFIFSVLILFLFLCSVPTISQSGLRCHFFTFLFFTIYIHIRICSKRRKKYFFDSIAGGYVILVKYARRLCIGTRTFNNVCNRRVS